jgi:hypothetical protein
VDSKVVFFVPYVKLIKIVSKQLAVRQFKEDIITIVFLNDFRCLEESKWDMKKALTVFTDLYKLGKIPPEAFHGL